MGTHRLLRTGRADGSTLRHWPAAPAGEDHGRGL